MNPIEDRLRDAFRTDAATIASLVPSAPRTTPRPGSITGHPRARSAAPRGRLVLPLAAAAAVAAVAAATFAGPAIWPGYDRHSQAGQAAPLGSGFPGGRVPATAPPKFLVAILFGPSGNLPSARLKVIDAKTGKVTGQLASPAPHRYFQAVAPLGNDQTFVVEAAGTRCDSWFYTFRLTALGKPTGLVPLAVPEVAGRTLNPQSLAASASGHEVAFATKKCSAVRRPKPYGQVGVIDLTTSAVTTWSFRWPAAPGSLSLSADGSLLGMASNPSSGAPGSSIVFNAAWVIKTDAPAGPLSDHYRKVFGPPHWPLASVLSPNGSLVWALTPVQKKHPYRLDVRLSAYRTASGRLAGSWNIFRPLHELTDPSIFTADTSGRYVLIANVIAHVRILDLATRKVTEVPGTVASGPVPIDIAW